MANVEFIKFEDRIEIYHQFSRTANDVYRALKERENINVLWDPQEKCRYIDNSISEEHLLIIKKYLLAKKFSINFFSIEYNPVINGLFLGDRQLFDYQLDGIRFIDENDGNCILADDMGLGKSIQAIAYTIWRNRRVLIICPANAKNVWIKELNSCVGNKSIFVFETKKSVHENFENLNNFDYCIINYSIISDLSEEILKHKIEIDQVICDESHYLKETKSKKTKAIKKMSPLCKSFLLMSGTFMKNLPIELYSQLNLIKPDIWHNKHEFGLQYCQARQILLKNRNYKIWTYSGSCNLFDLKKKISPYYLRRTKNEVLQNIPEKKEEIVIIDKPIEEINEVNEPVIRFLAESKENQGYLNWLVSINKMRQISSEKKINSTLDKIKDLILEGKKVLLFVSWMKTFDEFEKLFVQNNIKFVSIRGGHSDKKRKESVSNFQEDTETMVFLGSIMATKESITLTSAYNVIIHDIEWVPTDIGQAIDRCCRIGQNMKVNVYYQVIKDSYEYKLLDTLLKKQITSYQLIESKKRYFASILRQSMVKMIKDYNLKR